MTTTDRTPTLTARDFASLGMDQVAYVKRVVDGSVIRYAIHAADGTHMGMMLDLDTAFAALRQNDIEPLSVH